MEQGSAEEMKERHKKELKELQAKIQSMKHAVPKGDKKKKKQVTSEIAILEAELQKKHDEELRTFENDREKEINDVSEQLLNLTTTTTATTTTDTNEEAANCSTEVKLTSPSEEKSEGGIVESTAPEVVEKAAPEIVERAAENKPPKLSKAQKRKAKKEAEERERAERIAAAEKEVMSHTRNIEARKFDELLKTEGLRIVDINPDGNCMYEALLVHLNSSGNMYSVQTLRQQTAEHMLSHRDDYLPFTMSQSTGDMMSGEEFEKYCSDISETNAWGGNLELQAVSQLVKRPIKIYQSDSGPILIGEEFDGPALSISYHRHQYGLGEHYNSLLVEDR